MPGSVEQYEPDGGLPERFGGGLMERVFQAHASIIVLVNLFLVAIWAASGMGYFWPIWPFLGWGLGVGIHGAVTYGLLRR